MRPSFIALVVGLCLLGGPAVGQDRVVERQRPNVLMIMTDDQGWFDLGVHGNRDLATPNLDRLASQGVRFTRFYAEPVCTPTRASLMTGRHFQRTGAIDTYMGRDTLDAGEFTLGQLFQGQGYRTAIVGKWHLGRYRRYHPRSRGFDTFFGFWQYGFINRYDDPDELFWDDRPVTATGYITDVLTDVGIDFVRQRDDRPFFLYMAYNAPHSPYLVPDRYIVPYLNKGIALQDARIYGMVTCLDENIGRLLAALEETGAARETIVLFLTDNGGVSHHYKAGLRGNKGSVYEGGIRVPLFVRWPGRIPPGTTVDVMGHVIDILPTLAEAVGVPLPTDRPLDGRGLLSLMGGEGGPSPHAYLYHQWTRVRPNARENWAVQDGRMKLVNGQLYDLLQDVGEEQDLAAERPEEVARLRGAFDAWFTDVTAGRDYGRVPIEVGRPDEDPVELDVTWAEPVGAKVRPVYRHYNRDAIEGWSEEGDAVRWGIDVKRGGPYEVVLWYGGAAGDEGSRMRVECGEAALEAVVEPRAGQGVFQPHTIGRIQLPSGPTTFTIEAAEITGRELMTLHKVWLRRVEP